MQEYIGKKGKRTKGNRATRGDIVKKKKKKDKNNA